MQVGVLTIAAGWILDQATKAAVLSELGDGRVVDMPGPLYLELTRNAGAAFGLPAPWWVFLLVTAVVIVLVTRNLPRSQSLLEPLAYGLLLAGALGNVTDRLLRPAPHGVGRGEVVDFIATTFRFPTFNVADVCITVGFALLVIVAYWQERAAREESAVAETGRVPGSA